MMKTVAIISDTHSSLDPRIQSLIEQCDYALHAGDICGQNVLDAMKPKSGKVVAVLGNNDHYYHGDQLPSQDSLELPGGTISVEHGHRQGMSQPRHDSLREAHADSRVVVYGHTHAMTQDRSSQPWVINPGAAGNERTKGGPSCLILTAHEKQEWEIEEFRFSDVASAPDTQFC